jgi:hypothetical protein
MANLDTRSKRASSVALFGLLLSPVLPDGTLSQGGRQHVAFSYSGVLAAGGTPPEGTDNTFIPCFRRRKR